jgi:hypothetical protein
VDVVITNPPFGKKSSITIVNEEGDTDRQTLTYSLPEPHLLAQEIADDLRSALAQIEDVLGDLEQRVGGGAGGET